MGSEACALAGVLLLGPDRLHYELGEIESERILRTLYGADLRHQRSDRCFVRLPGDQYVYVAGRSVWIREPESEQAGPFENAPVSRGRCAKAKEQPLGGETDQCPLELFTALPRIVQKASFDGRRHVGAQIDLTSSAALRRRDGRTSATRESSATVTLR